MAKDTVWVGNFTVMRHINAHDSAAQQVKLYAVKTSAQKQRDAGRGSQAVLAPIAYILLISGFIFFIASLIRPGSKTDKILNRLEKMNPLTKVFE